MKSITIRDRTRDRYNVLSLGGVWRPDVVRGTRALVIGAGALGNEGTKNLTMLGARWIGVVDHDVVEVANLTRSVFFREEDHGRPKAAVLAERLRQLNPDVTIDALRGRLDDMIGLGLLRRVNFVLSCVDNRIARRTLNRMCEKIGTPWVDGAMEDLVGTVTTYMPGNGACYECGLNNAQLQAIAESMSCNWVARRATQMARVPTTSTMGSIIGAFQVQEALRILHPESLKATGGTRIVLDGVGNDFYIATISRRDDCASHTRFSAPVEVPGFRAAVTTAEDVLEHHREATGERGVLRLGCDVAHGLGCRACGAVEKISMPVRTLTEERAVCPSCGAARALSVVNTVSPGDTLGRIPLSALGAPPLEILEVSGKRGFQIDWLTGDLALFPALEDPPRHEHRASQTPETAPLA